MNYSPTRGYRVQVRRIQQLTPHFTRITFTGDELQHFGHAGFDQRIKLLFPNEDGSFADCGLFDDPAPSMSEWYHRWRCLPDEQRNPMRTYTVRAARSELAEVDIDFVLHGVTGPASAWASAAVPGDEIVMTGPDARAQAPALGGVEWHPGSAERVLLAGDETAAPAICTILEGLDERVAGLALIEVPTSRDELVVAAPARVEVRWLGRDGAAHGSLLKPAVEQWGRERASAGPAGNLDDPDPESILWEVPPEQERRDYAWLAGESSVITSLRRQLVRDLGIERSVVAFMGYWRQGRAEN